jgi:amino acid adenylation domain-containing protein
MKSLLAKIRNSGLLLELVNGELKLYGDGTRPDPELVSEIKARKKELIEFLKENAQQHHTAAAIPAVPVQADYALSTSQRRLWVMSQFEEANIAYNMPAVYVFEGNLNREALEHAFNTLIERHESLRTRFRENASGEVRQVICSLAEIGFAIAYKDLRGEANPAVVAKQLVAEDMLRPFDLARGPMIRAGLLQVEDHAWLFTYAMHHIVSDGWSMGVLISELMLLYNAYGSAVPNPLPALRIQYKDYAAWQEKQLSGASLEAHRQYWLDQFAGELPQLDFPADYPRPLVKSYNGGTIHHPLNSELANGIKALCQEQGSTLFMGLLAAVNAILFRYTGQQDIVTGTQIAGREHADLDNQIGFYLNTLALRARFTPTDRFTDLLAHVKAVTLGAYAHQVFPFDELVNALPVQRDMSRTPLFDVSVVLHNTETAGVGSVDGPEALRISLYDTEHSRSGLYELAFDFRETPDGIHCMIVYNSDVYAEKSIQSLARHFEQLLAAAVASPETALADLNLLGDGEREQLIHGFNANAVVDYPADQSIVDLFVQQAADTPDAIALEYDDVQVTYQQLHLQSDALARYLISNHQLQPDDRVGILLERSPLLIIAVLGILKAGAAYVPIDNDYPRTRKAFIADDTAIRALITSTDYMFDADYYNGPLIALDVQLDDMLQTANQPLPDVAPDHLAYIMYTSGTTGNPKGVMVMHRNVVRLVKPGRFAGLNGSEKILSTGAVSFDATTFEYWGALLRGGTLVLCSKEILLDDNRLGETIKAKGINTMWFTAGWLNQLVEKNINLFEGLATILAGGDVLSPLHIGMLRKQYPELRIINGYGPTENTTFSLTHTIAEVNGQIPVGTPIDNSTAYILDNAGRPQPIGIVGELWVGGAGLSRGYLNQPELTAEKFVAHPFIPGERLYKTGDLGRWRPDGTIAFAGRKDTQVKVRGYRIELAEIEQALLQHPDISSAAVIARANADGDKELVAYIVSASVQNNATLNAFLGERLPVYMQPAFYVQLDALPLNANGKIDRKQLPDPEGAGLATGVAYISPRTPTEEKLVAIWQEILGHTTIGVKDDFFSLGGHSLKATRLASQIHKTFDVKVDLKDLFSKTILEEQADLIDTAGKEHFESILPAPLQDSYPLSSSQRRLWVLSQFEEANMAYNMPAAYIFRGELNIHALDLAFTSLIERHESLRTVFREDDQSAVRQFICSAAELGFTIAKDQLPPASDAEKDSAVNHWVQEMFNTTFDLAKGPLIRAGLLEVGDREWVFAYTMHHIISDGWSMGLLINELMQGYNAYQSGEAPSMPPLRIQYKDYATWQQQELSGAALAAHKEYWLTQFEGELPVLDLPTDYPRPVVKTYNGNAVGYHISPAVTQTLKALLQEQGGTLFMGLLAAVNSLLHRYSNQEDIIVGTPIAGRPHSDLHDQIGFYINTLALRTRFSGDSSFRDLLAHVKALTLGAYDHQVFPFDELVNSLSLQMDTSRSALFDVMVILQNNELHEKGADITIDGLEIGGFGGGESLVSKFDLMFSFVDAADGGIDMVLEYNTDLYSDSRAVTICTHFERLLQGLVQAPDKAIGALDYLSEEERIKIVDEFNNNASAYDPALTMTSYLDAQLLRTPDAVALSVEERTLTYQQLHTQANQLAHYLRQEYDIKPGDLVSVLLPREEWLVIALLGVLKSGGAYVPVDPAYPQERIDYLLSDSKSRLLIDADWITTFRSVQMNYPDSAPVVKHQPDDLAYIIYTSGSTGQPKGVMIEHRNVSAFLHWCLQEFDPGSFEVVFGVTSVCFDISIFELFYTLSVGKRLRLLDNALAIPTWLAVEKRVLLNTVPSVVGNLIREQQDFSAVTIMNLAGEAIPDQYTEWLDTDRMKVLNLYGPSEDTTYSTYFQLQKGQPIRVGKPIANSQAYILNSHDQVQPIGVIGEIVLSGDGISRGYLHRPELTAAKYESHPFIPGKRIYRTGDLGRWMPDGNIDCIGRKDAQIKLRGYRIELGEIENCLLQHESVDEAAVMVRTNASGEKDLVAYVTGSDSTVAALRQYLSNRLPAFMVPGYFVALEALPLTPNGKIDRKRLPDPSGATMASGIAYVPPTNPIEEKLIGIWQQVLGAATIGIKDNFFALGGHSLKATQLAARIHQTFEVKVGLRELFTATVLEDQARLIAQSHRQQFVAISPVASQADYALSSAQRRLWVLGQIEEGSIAYNMPAVYTFDGLMHHDALEKALMTMIDRHEILRTVFHENEKSDVRQFIVTTAASGFHLRYDDYRSDANAETAVEQAIQAELVTPFDLAKGPLIRALLCQLTDTQWVFAYTMHHIISDGWSMEVMMAELMSLYHAFSHGQNNPLPPLRLQYKDYAAWQQAQLADDSIFADKSYWLNQFAGELPILSLPGDYPRPVVKTYNGAILVKELDASLAGQLREYSSQQGASLFMSVLALVNTLLYRYTGQEDIVVGSPIAGRSHNDLQDQIGFYVNSLALRSRFTGADSFQSLVAQCRQLILDAYEHQAFPFDELVDSLPLQHDTSRTPLFDIMVVLQNNTAATATTVEAPGDLSIQPYGKGTHTVSKFDLTFFFEEVGDALLLKMEYNTDIYSAATVNRMTTHIGQLLGAVLASPEAPISSFALVNEKETQVLLQEFNATTLAYPDTETAISIFEVQVASHPEHPAVVIDGNPVLTYQELNEAANRFSAWLRQQSAIQHGDLVGIEMDRSANFIIAVFGVLKCGAAYLPIDPSYPVERIDYIISDSRCKVVVNTTRFDEFLLVQEQYPATNPILAAGPADLAYVIYTSGSTGLPKGIEVAHRSLINLCYWNAVHYELTYNDRSSMFASVSFDASVYELFFCLLSGGILYVLPDEIRTDAKAILDFYTYHQLTVCFLPTQIAEKVIALEPHPECKLRWLILGGDKLNTYAKRSYRISNSYGPTENTVMVTAFEVDQLYSNIPIGKPIGNNRVYIVNDALQLQPVGIPGEILIAGDSLAIGYRDRPELTAEKFIEFPLIPGERVYRTGDLGRWLPDGNIEFLGRLDTQVKIRGFRIEIGEIETLLLQHPDITEVAVVPYTNVSDEKELAAYIVSEATLHSADLRSFLGRMLPGYMIPAYFVQLPDLPLTPNGKVNKKALPDPTGIGIATGAAYIAPRNQAEAILTTIWQEVLGLEKVGIEDNFFDLGGNSIRIIKMVSLVNTAFQIKLPVVTAFKYPNISALAEHLQTDKGQATPAVEASDEDIQDSVSIMEETFNVLNNLNNEA